MNMMKETYLPRQQAADFIGIHYVTLDKMRKEGWGPEWFRSGSNRIYYKESSIIEWMADENRFYPNGTFGPDEAANRAEKDRISKEAIERDEAKWAAEALTKPKGPWK